MSAEAFLRETHTFADHGSIQLSLDVYTPLQSQFGAPSPVLMWFHGGYLITGSRLAIPEWLLNHAMDSGWVVVSPDYRVLPESTGYTVIEDLESAYAWVVTSLNSLKPECNADTSQIILGGASAGGWCAVVSALQISAASLDQARCLPPPMALFLMYPMIDLGSERWAQCVSLPGSGVDPALKHQLLSQEVPRRIATQEISPGEDFPTSEKELLTRKRLPLLYAILEEAVILDYLTGMPGFAKKRMAAGLENLWQVDIRLQRLFPLDCADFRPPYPPTIVIHGSADLEVPCSEAQRLVGQLEKAGIFVCYFEEADAGHTFDLGWSQPNETLCRALKALQEIG